MLTQTATSPTSTKITAVDLFCGVGGLTRGLINGGVNVAAGVDTDRNCEFSYEANNKSQFVCKDVAEYESADFLDAFDKQGVSLLAGCAPCQSFSTYSRGRRAGSRVNDWQLVDEFARLIREAQPHLVTMENVPPLIQKDVFKRFLASLPNYHIAYGVFQCAELGIPQSRKRLVLVASRLGPIELPRPLDEVRTVRQAIAQFRNIEAGESDPNDPMHTACRLSAKNLQRIRHSIPGGTWRDWPRELLAPCHARDSGATYPSVYGRMEWDAPGPTITTQCFGYGNGRFGHPEQDRAITLREAATLQTFPADYQFLFAGEAPSFAKLGRLIGNAVPVKLGEKIANVLQSHVDKYLGSN